ncbi:uncharacterized protein VDAG_04851 [Verticillium dahliae VdLs.17]|uniref:MULE transposase domain-containing protein n=2 Tax=Verticillium dahliae TaxID=27337 RepID=G2X366_VERDV|nr:uncharacterized protein VDAG_04851 [Verticillium dahliae VdLs.17]AER39703.1 transposase [Verticillium dahliae]EGY23413.1 hypothetical protein VDAG_04851 [Verticillium dahliae VdLs.17]
MDLDIEDIQDRLVPVGTLGAPREDEEAEERFPPIPNPPDCPPADTVDDLQKSLQDFARANGFAIIRRNASNYRNGKPTYYNIIDDWKWSFTLKNGDHNHGPSIDPSVHKLHRKMTEQQLTLLATVSKHKAIKSREAAAIVRDAVPGSLVKQKDIDNARQRLRLDALQGRTPVQAFFHILRDSGLRHRVLWSVDYPDRADAIVWTYPWCERMWKRFPEVLGLDNTYKTNRFKMPFFQVTGTTDISSLFNCAFGLVSNERREGYDFLLQSIESIRTEIGAAQPHLQLCIFHINANVKMNAKKKWKGPGGILDDELDVNRDKEAAEAAAIQDAIDNAGPVGRRELPATAVEHRPSGFYRLWQYVIYADAEEDFKAAWQRLQDEFKDQEAVLEYVIGTYMPYRHQWAHCYISQYTNFGVRTNSPTETAHKDIKSFVVNGNSDLFALANAVDQMLKNKQRTYTERIAEMETKTRRIYLGQDWLGTVSKEVGYHALGLLSKQRLIALTALPTAEKPNPPGLQPCQVRFTNQYRLPCSHRLLELFKAGKQLTKDFIHPRWWLRQPLNVADSLLGIKDPKIVTSLRGRPRNDRTSSGVDTPSSSAAPASSAGRQPRQASNPAPRPVRASIRRNRSAFEDDDREWPQEADEQVKRRREEEDGDNRVKRQRAPRKCSKCGSFEHNARTCSD